MAGRRAQPDPRLDRHVEASREFYAGRPARRGPTSYEELLAVRGRASEPRPSDPPPLVERVGAGGRTVPVRVHLPRQGAAQGLVTHLHGGGFYLGSAADDDVEARRLADALGCVVVGVDYRLAPDEPWPAAPDDCETAALWAVEHAAPAFGATSLALCGFSAGATLALVTLLRLRDRGLGNAVGGAVLQFGTYDLSGRTPAGRLIADEYFLRAYVGAADPADPDVSPVFADLAGLPPILMVVGGADVLLRDNVAMAERLAAAGVAVDLRVYPEAPHGFTGHPTPMARAARDDIDGWLRDRLLRDGQAGEVGNRRG